MKSSIPPIIYLDMDGVLVDLNSSLFKILNKIIEDYKKNFFQEKKYNKKLVQNAIQSLKNKPLKFSHMRKEKSTSEIIELSYSLMINNKEFWSNLSWNKEGIQLWNFISGHYDVSLLTTPVDKDCEEGKLEWAQKCLKISPQKVLFCDKNKGKFANKNTLLIDDFPENILNFQQAGGKAILFTSFAEILPHLLQYLPY
jgi:5'(3')-deoxyribonucleotidase